jgi:hypothetical protein
MKSKRLSDGPRPGVSTCSKPGKAIVNGRRMLGQGSLLYKTKKTNSQSNRLNNSQSNRLNNRQSNRLNNRQIDIQSSLKKQDRLGRLEIKIQQVEQNQALSRIETKTEIDLMKGEYRDQLKSMKDYIQTLELKIKQLSLDTKENITLEIIENSI